MEKQVVKLSHTTCTTHKWPHPHVPAYLRLPISPMEIRANNLTDVVVLSFWTSLMKISTTWHVCEGLTKLTTPTHFACLLVDHQTGSCSVQWLPAHTRTWHRHMHDRAQCIGVYTQHMCSSHVQNHIFEVSACEQCVIGHASLAASPYTRLRWVHHGHATWWATFTR